MPGAITHSAFSRIGQLASLPRVHAAFQWFHLHYRKMMQWQQELVSIAAPPLPRCYSTIAWRHQGRAITALG
jgi:hypothetical protein